MQRETFRRRRRAFATPWRGLSIDVASTRLSVELSRRCDRASRVTCASRAVARFQRFDARASRCDEWSALFGDRRRHRCVATQVCVRARKNIRDVVDTLKNRDYVSPSRRFLQKQVSKIITTTRKSISTSARTIKTVDVGSLSPAEWSGVNHEALHRNQPDSPLTDRVFVCRAAVWQSVPPAIADLFRSSARCWRWAMSHPFRRALHADGWSRARPRHCLVLGSNPR